jgi:hypothetical protein
VPGDALTFHDEVQRLYSRRIFLQRIPKHIFELFCAIPQKFRELLNGFLVGLQVGPLEVSQRASRPIQRVNVFLESNLAGTVTR